MVEGYIQAFKEDCKEIYNQIGAIEQSVFRGVVTYAALVSGVSDVAEKFSNNYSRIADYIVVLGADFVSSCEEVRGILNELAEELKNGTITQKAFSEKVNHLENIFEIICP